MDLLQNIGTWRLRLIRENVRASFHLAVTEITPQWARLTVRPAEYPAQMAQSGPETGNPDEG